MKVFHTEVLQRGRVMEIPSTPERPTVNRSIDVGESVRNGIRVDG